MTNHQDAYQKPHLMMSLCGPCQVLLSRSPSQLVSSGNFYKSPGILGRVLLKAVCLLTLWILRVKCRFIQLSWVATQDCAFLTSSPFLSRCWFTDHIWQTKTQNNSSLPAQLPTWLISSLLCSLCCNTLIARRLPYPPYISLSLSALLFFLFIYTTYQLLKKFYIYLEKATLVR